MEKFERKEVSVVVAAYNAEKTIWDTIKSICEQDFNNFELIIVDDGSTDNTYKLIKEYVSEHNMDTKYGEKETGPEEIKIIHTKNRGVSAARNTGIENAVGRWILFFDADDLMPYNYLSTLLDKASDDIDMVIGNILKMLPDGDMDEAVQEYDGLYETLNNPDNLIKMADISAIPGTKLIRKSIIDLHDIRFIDVLAEDVAMYLEVLYFCRAVYVNNHAVMKYRITPESMSRNVSERELTILGLFDTVREFLAHHNTNSVFEYAIANMEVKIYRIYGLHFTGTDDKKLRKKIFKNFANKMVETGEKYSEVLCDDRKEDIERIKKKLKRSFIYLNPLYIKFHRFKWRKNKEVL